MCYLWTSLVAFCHFPFAPRYSYSREHIYEAPFVLFLNNDKLELAILMSLFSGKTLWRCVVYLHAMLLIIHIVQQLPGIPLQTGWYKIHTSQILLTTELVQIQSSFIGERAVPLDVEGCNWGKTLDLLTKTNNSYSYFWCNNNSPCTVFSIHSPPHTLERWVGSIVPALWMRNQKGRFEWTFSKSNNRAVSETKALDS